MFVQEIISEGGGLRVAKGDPPSTVGEESCLAFPNEPA